MFFCSFQFFLSWLMPDPWVIDIFNVENVFMYENTFSTANEHDINFNMIIVDDGNAMHKYTLIHVRTNSVHTFDTNIVVYCVHINIRKSNKHENKLIIFSIFVMNTTYIEHNTIATDKSY